jgi:uncharacterized membrane protein YccC
MTKQPHDCPKPPGQCPYEQDDIAVRLARIETLLQRDAESRREFAEHMTRTIDQQFLSSQQHEEHIGWLREAVRNILSLMQGEMGRPGIVVEGQQTMGRLSVLERWRDKQGAFIAGVVAAGSAVGGLIGFLGAFIFHWIFKRS